jgi:hypothetical protein
MPTLSPNRDVDQFALRALAWWLLSRDYSQHSREAIVAHAAAEGTPTGCGYLDPSDEAAATETFIGAMAPVPSDDPAWDDETMCLDAEMLALGNHPWPIPAREEDDDDRAVPPDAAPMPPEFEPTAEDLADYDAWLADLERRRDRHSPDALARIHRALYGQSGPFHA